MISSGWGLREGGGVRGREVIGEGSVSWEVVDCGVSFVQWFTGHREARSKFILKFL